MFKRRTTLVKYGNLMKLILIFSIIIKLYLKNNKLFILFLLDMKLLNFSKSKYSLKFFANQIKKFNKRKN